MATKAATSRVWPRKGESFQMFLVIVGGFSTNTLCSFGWVNASYVYGLQLVNAHMRRALGTLTPWEVYRKATEDTLPST